MEYAPVEKTGHTNYLNIGKIFMVIMMIYLYMV